MHKQGSLRTYSNRDLLIVLYIPLGLCVTVSYGCSNVSLCKYIIEHIEQHYSAGIM